MAGQEETAPRPTPDSASPIQVVGIGLDGANGLVPAVRRRVEAADILVGSPRHLAYFPDHPAERWSLGDLKDLGDRLKTSLAERPCSQIVVLTSGDPLFFGLGRFLLTVLPADTLSFYPHISSVQLIFSRLKLPWQDACLVSIHGRDPELLIRALKRGEDKIAVLGDPQVGLDAIATLITDLTLPSSYQIWIGENLGGPNERLHCYDTAAALTSLKPPIDPLHILVLLRQTTPTTSTNTPILGIADHQFHSFSDRPGLMTKREVRVLVLAALNLHPNQTIWDIGAGTGSVSIEIARLVPTATIYALEKTAAGITLIHQNCEQWGITNIHAIQANFPQVNAPLPAPDRVFIGGSGRQLTETLHRVSHCLRPTGHIVLALATIESLAQLTHWLQEQPDWSAHFLQVNLARSVSIGQAHRFSPLNPVTIVTLSPPQSQTANPISLPCR